MSRPLTAREALAHTAGRNPDVVLLDLGLPDGDGLEVARRLREWTQVPIIVISARGREHDKIAALDAGADDYLTKPFGVGELLARIRVALRHAQRAAGGVTDPIVRTGALTVDFERAASARWTAPWCISRRPSTSCWLRSQGMPAKC